MAEAINRPHHYQIPLTNFSQGKNNNFKISFLGYLAIIIILLAFIIGIYSIQKNETNYNLLDAVVYSGYNLKYIANFISNFSSEQSPIPIQNDSSTVSIVSDQQHWDHMPVSFGFSNPEDCGSFQTYRILRAFDEITNATSGKVSFIESNDSVNINIICNKNFLPPSDPGLLQSGEANVFSNGNVILSADINFYNTGGDNYNGGCRNYPDVEIHEILHAFGFQHTDAPYNIMNPVGTYCPTHINDDIVERLMSIYG